MWLSYTKRKEKKEIKKLSKKVTILVIVSILLLLIIALCIIFFINKSNNDLKGSYRIIVYDLDGVTENIGTLYLYDNNQCLINKISFIEKTKNRYSYNDCTYNVLDNKITFKYRYKDWDYETETCSIIDYGLNCSFLVSIKPRRDSELWYRFSEEWLDEYGNRLDE